MNTLFANQAFDTALIALIGVITAYISLRVKQAEQGAQLDAVQQQQAKQGSTVVVTPAATLTATATPVPVVPAQPASAGAPQEQQEQTLVAASVQCPHCAQQVHLDSLMPAPERQSP